jgi:predicted nucleic acid-binding protein
MIILDTNVISALMRVEPEQSVIEWLDGQPSSSIWITAVTVMEIHFGLQTMPLGRHRQGFRKSFEQLLQSEIEGRIAPFDTDAARHAADLMAVRKRKGRPGEVRDTMIAGIALARHATLATRNSSHFADLSVTVVNPWVRSWNVSAFESSSKKGWQRALRRLFWRAKIKKPDGTPKRCHPHMFRDTFAVELLLSGVPIDQVSLLLGHSSVKVTEKHYAPFVKARQAQLESSVKLSWQVHSEWLNQSDPPAPTHQLMWSESSEDREGGQDSTVSVFTRDAKGTLRHFYTAHPRMAPDIQERGIDLLTPICHLMDLTPQGRGSWYASLAYGTKVQAA